MVKEDSKIDCCFLPKKCKESVNTTGVYRLNPNNRVFYCENCFDELEDEEIHDQKVFDGVSAVSELSEIMKKCGWSEHRSVLEDWDSAECAKNMLAWHKRNKPRLNVEESEDKVCDECLQITKKNI